MEHIHSEFNAQAGAVVSVALDRRADVLLLDPVNYMSFRLGSSFQYLGGEAVRSPARISVPHTGHWHVVLVPTPGTTIRYSINLSV